MRQKTPFFSPLKYEKMKKKSQINSYLIKKTGDVIKKSETYKNLAFFSSTNQYQTNVEIPYHFPEFWILKFET